MLSEKEVLEKIERMGDLQLKQTEKIEELMLYTIEQKKRIEALEKRFDRRLDELVKKK